jgi:ribosomal 50S subunit-associated protein YjgA (DUF615 family)
MSDDIPSKTQRKREMHELQDLGAELVGPMIPARDDRAAGTSARCGARCAPHDEFEAKRRQLQYIGKIMRSIDRNRSANGSMPSKLLRQRTSAIAPDRALAGAAPAG